MRLVAGLRAVRVVIVAADPARRELLRALLAPVADLRIVAAVAEIRMRRGRRDEVLLVDHDFSGDDARLLELGRLRRRRVVVTSVSQLRSDIWMALSCGVLGYASSDAEVVTAVRSAAAGRPYRPQSLGEPPAWVALPQPGDRICAYLRERERSRYNRIIHDHVLQALEGLALSPAITDVELRTLLLREAGVLRRQILPGAEEDAAPLLAELRSVIARHHRAPLDVVLRTEGDTTPPLTGGTLRALTDAANEALRNIGKHAATRSAAVTVTAMPDAVRIRVADSGVGFNPRMTRPGFGLNQSIVARMQAVGGSATIDSAPGRGTVVELTGPATRQADLSERRAA